MMDGTLGLCKRIARASECHFIVQWWGEELCGRNHTQAAMQPRVAPLIQ